MKKRILITGATGFIGSNIINLLLKKNIYIYDILRQKNKNNKNIKKLQKNKKYHPIFYKKFNELEKKLKKINVNTVINCATYYSIKNDGNERLSCLKYYSKHLKSTYPNVEDDKSFSIY